MTYTRDGKKAPGFADVVVPALDIEEHNLRRTQADGSLIENNVDESKKRDAVGSPGQAHTEDGELYRAPADASKSPQRADQPPHERSGVADAGDQERAGHGARANLRKNLAGLSGEKTWTLPMPTPKVDPQGFEDPISETFWKNVWIACAVHNVSTYHLKPVNPHFRS